MNYHHPLGGGVDAVQRCISTMTELLRRLAVPIVATGPTASHLASIHAILCRRLEPHLGHALQTIKKLEELEADYFSHVAKGELDQAHDLQCMMDGIVHEARTQAMEESCPSSPLEDRRRGFPKGMRALMSPDGRVSHDQGFCAAVSPNPLPPSPKRREGRRCLPTNPRKPPAVTSPVCNAKNLTTRTGLMTTIPTAREQSASAPRSARKSPGPRQARSHSRGRSPSHSTPQTPQRATPPPSYLHPVTPSPPPRTITPPRHHDPTPRIEGSPRRDQEFIFALLRSLQLEQYIGLFSNLGLLSFYQLGREELAGMGMPEPARSTLYESISQIKQIADAQR